MTRVEVFLAESQKKAAHYSNRQDLAIKIYKIREIKGQSTKSQYEKTERFVEYYKNKMEVLQSNVDKNFTVIHEQEKQDELNDIFSQWDNLMQKIKHKVT